jgi:RNA polymerase sigma factor (sigma-70 family)
MSSADSRPPEKDPPEFAEALRRLRAGDDRAAQELVDSHLAIIRRAVRYVLMKHPRARPAMDSVDVAQEVLLSFFVGLGEGKYDLRDEEDLRKLLVVMARNKAVSKMRALGAVKRGGGHEAPVGADVPSPEATPSVQVGSEELLAEVLKRLSAEERWLLEQRLSRRSWSDIAAELQERCDTVSKRLRRALARIARELGVDGFGDVVG